MCFQMSGQEKKKLNNYRCFEHVISCLMHKNKILLLIYYLPQHLLRKFEEMFNISNDKEDFNILCI